MVYKVVCEECLSRGIRKVYYGETSRTAYERGKEHVDGYMGEKEANHMYKHVVNEHGGERVNFSMKVVSCHDKPLSRQLEEAVLIEEEKESSLMNSKSEFNRCRIPRISIMMGNDLVKENGDDLLDTTGAHPDHDCLQHDQNEQPDSDQPCESVDVRLKCNLEYENSVQLDHDRPCPGKRIFDDAEMEWSARPSKKPRVTQSLMTKFIETGVKRKCQISISENKKRKITKVQTEENSAEFEFLEKISISTTEDSPDRAKAELDNPVNSAKACFFPIFSKAQKKVISKPAITSCGGEVQKTHKKGVGTKRKAKLSEGGRAAREKKGVGGLRQINSYKVCTSDHTLNLSRPAVKPGRCRPIC